MLLGDGGGDGEGGNTNLVLADSHDGLVLCGYWSVQQRKERRKCGGGKRKLAREKYGCASNVLYFRKTPARTRINNGICC